MKYFRYIVTLRLKKGEKRGAYTTTTYKNQFPCRHERLPKRPKRLLSASSADARRRAIGIREVAGFAYGGARPQSHVRINKRKRFPSIQPRSPQVKITNKAKGRSSDSSPVTAGLPDSKISDRKSAARPRRERG